MRHGRIIHVCRNKETKKRVNERERERERERKGRKRNKKIRREGKCTCDRGGG